MRIYPIRGRRGPAGPAGIFDHNTLTVGPADCDYKTIQAAVNYAKTHATEADPYVVLLAQDTFTEEVNMSGVHYVTVAALSRDGCIVQAFTPDTGKAFYNVDSNTTIRNLTIKGPSTTGDTPNARAISIKDNAVNVWVDGCYLDAYSDCVYTASGVSGLVISNTVANAVYDAFQLSGCTGAIPPVVRDCDITVTRTTNAAARAIVLANAGNSALIINTRMVVTSSGDYLLPGADSDVILVNCVDAMGTQETDNVTLINCDMSLSITGSSAGHIAAVTGGYAGFEFQPTGGNIRLIGCKVRSTLAAGTGTNYVLYQSHPTSKTISVYGSDVDTSLAVGINTCDLASSVLSAAAYAGVGAAWADGETPAFVADQKFIKINIGGATYRIPLFADA